LRIAIRFDEQKCMCARGKNTRFTNKLVTFLIGSENMRWIKWSIDPPNKGCASPPMKKSSMFVLAA
jgi:hypothetical protein